MPPMEEQMKIIDLVKNEYFVQWVISPSEESKHYWAKWLSAHPHRRKDVEFARQLISSAHYKINDTMPEEDYNLVLENIINYSQKKKETRYQLGYPSWKLLAVAASVILAICLAILTIRYTVQDSPGEVIVDQTIIKKSTLAGQKMRVKLPDGSQVVLNSETEIAYNLPFTGDRNVTLKGEAYFEVTKNESRPFIVRSGNITTKVLGTSFNVRSYPNEAENTIAVVTGKVKVSDAFGNEAHLVPNKRGVFDLAGKQLLVDSFSMEHEVGWKDGLLIFEEIPVEQVFNTLERWYAIKINLQDDELLKGNYTGRYKNESLEKVMQGIGYTMGFEFKISGKEVTVIKKP